MRFCLALAHHPAWTRSSEPAAAAHETLRTIMAADAAGLDSVWVSEDPDGWDAFALLGAAAGQTERIRLGTGVTNPFLRHPNLVAASVATLDRLSNGRAFLGLGRGQPEWYARSLGIPTGKPLAALGEAVDLLRQWWRPPHRAASDGHFQIDDWHRAVGPVQEHVPIYIAALGPKALALTARCADGLLVSDFASVPFLERLVPEMRHQVAAAGRDPDAFAFFVRTAIEVTDDPGPALERRKSLMALVHALPGMARQIEAPGFDVEAIMAQVRTVMQTDEVLARGGAFSDIRHAADFAAARRLIPTDLVEAVSFVGPADTIRSRLQRLVELGVTHVFLQPLSTPDPAAYADIIARINPDGDTLPS